MKNTSVAIRYAKAYFESCLEQNDIETPFNDISIIKDALSNSKELKAVLSNPIIKPDKKKIIVNDLFADKISEKTKKFIDFIIDQNRIDLLDAILQKFCNLYYDKKNIIIVEIKSYLELTEEQKKQLISKIERITSKTVQANFKVDETISGGLVIYFNDLVYDYSFNKQIEKLRAELMK